MTTQPFNDRQVSDMMSHYPGTAMRVAKRMADNPNFPSDDPAAVLKMVGTSQFKEEAAKAIDANGDSNAISGFLGSQPNIPDRDGSLDERSLGVLDSEAGMLRGEFRSKGALRQRQFQASQRLNEALEFNSVAHKAKRLKEINPTADIDSQMMKLRFRELKENADIRSNPEFSHLSPAQKQRLIQTNHNTTQATMSGLRDFRDARLSAAEARIEDEVAEHNSIISKAKTRLSNIDAQLEMVKATGEDIESQLNLEKERIKVEREIAKAKGKNGEAPWEYITESIILRMIRDRREPGPKDRENAESIGKEIWEEMERKRKRRDLSKYSLRSGLIGPQSATWLARGEELTNEAAKLIKKVP